MGTSGPQIRGGAIPPNVAFVHKNDDKADFKVSYGPGTEVARLQDTERA